MRVFVLVALLLLPASSPAATYHLEADGSGDFPTIAAALAVATAGDVVELGCGTYCEHDLVIPTGVTLRSEGGVASCATIDAQEQGRVLAGSPALLHGLTIRNGFPADWGSSGGGASLSHAGTIISCDFLNNRIPGGGARDECFGGGGGLYVGHGPVELLNCRFKWNWGCESSGAWLRGAATLSGCSFDGNGLVIDDGPAATGVLSGCDFRSCGLEVELGTLRICNSVFRDAWLITQWDLWLLDLASSSFIGAYFEHEQGWAEDGLLLFMNRCVVDQRGNGGRMGWEEESLSSAILDCNDLFGVEAPLLIADQIGQSGNFSADPLFCDAPGGDYRLHANSPCAPAGNACGVQIGALPVGCEATATEMRSWGSVKALY